VGVGRSARGVGLPGAPEVGWSVLVRDLASGADLIDVESGLVLPTASVGKVLLLIEVAEQLTSGGLAADELLERSSVAAVADSGVWQHLSAPTLSVADACLLVAAVSDNLATNVLLDRVGLAAVHARTTALGVRDTALLDLVRDERGPDNAPCLSVGSAREWVDVLAALRAGSRVSAPAGRLVLGWLAASVDLSLVADPLGLDPLAHAPSEASGGGIRLWNKTGCDLGTSADIGLVSGPAGTVGYAAIAHWDEAAHPGLRADVRAGMREVGETIARRVRGD